MSFGWCLPKKHGEGGLSFIQIQPQNRLIGLSSDFSYIFVWIDKGKSLSSWGSKFTLLIENLLILIRVQYPVKMLLLSNQF